LPKQIEIDGVGKVEVDDSFFSATPEAQQATVEEIKSSMVPPTASGAPTASTGLPGAPSTIPPKQRGNYNTPHTFAQMEATLNELYPGMIKVNSRQRSVQHNKEVGGVPGSHHVDGHSLDINPLKGVPIEKVRADMQARGFNMTEALFHKNHYHLTADSYTAPEGAEPHPMSQDDAVTEAQALFDAGGDRAEVEALFSTYGALPPKEQLDAAFASRDKGGTASFRPQPEADPDNPAGTAPAEPTEPPEGWGAWAKRFGGQAVSGATEGLIDTAGAASKSILPDSLAPLADTVLRAYYKKLGLIGDDPSTPAERYTRAGSRGLSASAVPGAALKGTIPVAKTLLAGAGAGIGSEAGHDVADVVAPGNQTADTLLSLAGGAIGGGAPFAPKAINKLANERFVKQQSKKNPFAAYDAEIAQDLKSVRDETAAAPTDPKGRAEVTIKTVNALEGRYAVGFKTKVNALPIPKADKRKLIDAIEGRYAITQPELDALRGSVPGDAVADAITKTQRLRALTPEIRPARNLATKAIGATINAVTPGIVGKVMRLTGGVGEAARVNSAAKVLKRGPAYEKLQQKVGPSGQRESQAALDDMFNQTVTKAETDKTLAAQAKAALDKANRKIVTDSHKDNVALTPKDGFRGYIEDATGLDVATQDIGLLILVKDKAISHDTMLRFLKNPSSLKGGAGSAIVSRLRKLADEGKLKRKDGWTGPTAAPDGGVMVDANGDPIRSLPAYNAGALKNILRELRDSEPQ